MASKEKHNYTEEVEALKFKLECTNKVITKLKDSLKIDRLANQGQLKKTRVLEHEIGEMKRRITMEATLREEAERRVKTVNEALQKERALRLKEMNQCRNFQRKAIEASDERKFIKQALDNEMKRIAILKEELLKHEIKNDAQMQIIAENDKEFKECIREIGKLNVRIIQLKNKLKGSMNTTHHHMEIRQGLECECQSLRTALTQTASSNKDHREGNRVSKARHIPSLKVEMATSQLKRNKLKWKNKINSLYTKNEKDKGGTETSNCQHNGEAIASFKTTTNMLKRDQDNYRAMIDGI